VTLKVPDLPPLTQAPLITGIWTGSTKEYHVAGSLRLTLNIASESRRRGTLAGTATNLNGTAPFKGHITGDAFTLTVNKASGGTIILTGTVNGTTLSGAWVNGGKSGTFSVTRHVA